MIDLEKRFRVTDQIPGPDLWPAIQDRLQTTNEVAITELDRSRERGSRPTRTDALRKALVVAAAFAVALVGILVVDRAFNDARSAHTPPPPRPIGSAWLKELRAKNTGINDVVRVRRGYVAVGYSYPRGSSAVWTSSDGVGWTRVPSASVPNAAMQSVTSDGAMIVGVGDGIFTSGDGRTWLRVPGSYGRLSDVEVYGSGFIATGEEGDVGSADGVIWTSANGRAWTRVSDPAVFGGPGEQSVQAVTVKGSRFVAVGYEAQRHPTYRSDAVVWTSSNGRTWARVQAPPHDLDGPGLQAMDAVVAESSGFIALGSDGPTESEVQQAVWTSSDGLHWVRIAFGPPFTDAAAPSVFAVKGGQGLLLAIEGNSVWESTDGRSWAPLSAGHEVFDPRTIRAISVAERGLVAVGTVMSYKGYGSYSVAWNYPASLAGVVDTKVPVVPAHVRSPMGRSCPTRGPRGFGSASLAIELATPPPGGGSGWIAGSAVDYAAEKYAGITCKVDLYADGIAARNALAATRARQPKATTLSGTTLHTRISPVSIGDGGFYLFLVPSVQSVVWRHGDVMVEVRFGSSFPSLHWRRALVVSFAGIVDSNLAKVGAGG